MTTNGFKIATKWCKMAVNWQKLTTDSKRQVNKNKVKATEWLEFWWTIIPLNDNEALDDRTRHAFTPCLHTWQKQNGAKLRGGKLRSSFSKHISFMNRVHIYVNFQWDKIHTKFWKVLLDCRTFFRAEIFTRSMFWRQRHRFLLLLAPSSGCSAGDSWRSVFGARRP